MSLKWFEWHTTHERFQGRLHALTKGRKYKFRFDLTNPSGEIQFDKNLVKVNPLAMDKVFEADGLKGKIRDEANYLMTRALTGHEALHALYTDPEDFHAAKTDPDVLMVMNLLEDARIENIGAEESYISGQLFKLYSAAVMKMMPKFEDPEMTDPYSWVSLLAHWREGYAIPQIADEQRKKWIELRNMAEDALYAPTSNDVLRISYKIVDLLGLGKKNKQPDQPQDQPSSYQGKKLKEMLDKTSGKMNGKSQQRPKQNPLDDPRPQKGSRDPQQDDGDQQQPGGGGQDDQQDDQSPQNGQDQQPGNGQGQNQSDQDDGDKGSPQYGGNDPKGDGHDDQDMSKGQPKDDDKGDPQQGNSSGQDGDDDDPSRNATQSQSLGDIVNNCQASVKDGPEQDIPQGDVKQLLRGAAASDPQAYNNRDIIGRPYMDIYEAARPIADEIKKELESADPKTSRSSSVYPGRLRMRYYMRDENKPFAKHNTKGKNIPKMALSLIIDRSESMRCRTHELRVTAAAVYLACEELKIPLDIWVLEGQIHLKKFDEWGPHVLAKIAGIQAITWTNMTPTLTSAADGLRKRPEPMKQMVMIHDGGPGDRRNVIDWRRKLGKLSLYCMLVVPDVIDSDATLPRKDDSMDELVGAGNYCIAFMKEIPKFWCSFIKNKREALAA